MRNVGPEDNFLQKVRDLATARNIVLFLMNALLALEKPMAESIKNSM